MRTELKPVIPFEPELSEKVPVDATGLWRYEIKWDGTRILTYHDQGSTRLFNRKQHERTLLYPELALFPSYCKADSVILDGEMIALGADGKPSFHEIMRRDLIRRTDRIQSAYEAVPATYMLFDIVYLNGEWVHLKPLQERLELLHQIIIPNERIQLAPAHPDGQALFQVMCSQGMEGIVCKKLDSPYTLGGKDGRWVKVKNYGDIIAVIGGYTLNGGIINAVLLGQYDKQGMLRYIGHVGTGKLTREDWRQLTERLLPHTISERPFSNRPDRHQDAFWVQPMFTAKVQYSEWRWQEGRTLRQPSIQAFVNQGLDQCIGPWI
ncbi:ATP-dependent DNA ligase [Paenibacillus sp. 203]|uniref:ATP-dependent DNA ligase n=1 Tax=Paenibacillus sp. 203 TaxID=3096765 RepID=UPI001F3BAE1A|nr:DNA ligase [Paenibacillus sp. UKAQ_18]